MKHPDDAPPYDSPAVLPLVEGIGVIPELGKVFVSLNGNPFGASLTAPHVYMLRDKRGQEKYALHEKYKHLLTLMLWWGKIQNAIVTGAEDGNTIMLKLSVPESDTPEFTLYNKMVELTQSLYDFAGNTQEIELVGTQLAFFTNMENPHRLRYHQAVDTTYANIRAGLRDAINAALQTEKLPPAIT